MQVTVFRPGALLPAKFEKRLRLVGAISENSNAIVFATASRPILPYDLYTFLKRTATK